MLVLADVLIDPGARGARQDALANFAIGTLDVVDALLEEYP